MASVTDWHIRVLADSRGLTLLCLADGLDSSWGSIFRWKRGSLILLVSLKTRKCRHVYFFFIFDDSANVQSWISHSPFYSQTASTNLYFAHIVRREKDGLIAENLRYCKVLLWGDFFGDFAVVDLKVPIPVGYPPPPIIWGVGGENFECFVIWRHFVLSCRFAEICHPTPPPPSSNVQFNLEFEDFDPARKIICIIILWPGTTRNVEKNWTLYLSNFCRYF